MSDTETKKETKKEISFFDKRIKQELGVKPKDNKIALSWIDDESGMNHNANFPIFSEDKNGNIRIQVYTLKKELIQYDHPDANPEVKDINNPRTRNFFITRLKEAKEYKDNEGKKQTKKYDIPAKAGTYPFFHPMLIKKYEKKEKIDTLILTEGYFKAFKGCMHGIPVVGLSSITHYKNKQTEEMYEDVQELIATCAVQNVIMLYDGDCRDLSESAIKETRDLSRRPKGFVNSCIAVRELLKGLNVDIYFSYVLSEYIDGNPKGLDDLMIMHPNEIPKIVEESTKLVGKKHYFFKINISNKPKLLFEHFKLNSVDVFYHHFKEKIRKVKAGSFVYNGTEFEYNEQKGRCIIVKPKEADDFFRVGDDYYEFINIPDKYDNLQKTYVRRLKSTISDDFGKNIFDHIPKYKAFCNVPNHENFQQIKHSCFNVYFEFTHAPEPGNCDLSQYFVKHIFGEQLDFGLDYIQLLYQKPTEILPILCLVSKENQTGKSTFIKWLKAMFGQNAAIIGNKDLSGDFNFHWATKLIIACEESFIEKKATVESIKSLSTAKTISMNRKGRDAGEVDFFGKFILASNNEDNFIIANADDIRYWVRKVPIITKKDPKFEDRLIDEIPYFLDFLSNRELSVKVPQSRMWFDEKSIRTDAFEKLVEHNQPTVVKMIKDYVRSIFIEYGAVEMYKNKPAFLMTLSYIVETVLNKRYEKVYVQKVMQDSSEIKFCNYTNEQGKIVAKRFKIPYWGEQPSLDNVSDDMEPCINYKSQMGKPYVFYANDYFTAKELEQLQIVSTDALPEWV